MAQWCDGFQRHVASALDGPFIVLFEEDRSHKTDDGVPVGEESAGREAQRAPRKENSFHAVARQYRLRVSRRNELCCSPSRTSIGRKLLLPLQAMRKRTLTQTRTTNGDLCPLPEPKLALYVFWAAGRTSAGQMALFLSAASAGLFFGSSDEPAIACSPRVSTRPR